MKFFSSDKDVPITSAVVPSAKIFKVVVAGIPDGESKPASGAVGTELREALRQLDLLLQAPGFQLQVGMLSDVAFTAEFS